MHCLTIITVFATVFGYVSLKNLCPVDWAEFKGECLYFASETRSWVDAEQDCRSRGAYLAADDNSDKHNFIRQIISVLKGQHIDGFFLGSDDFAFEGQWRWLQTGMPVASFTAWGTGMPQGEENHNCMQLAFEGNEAVWIDAECNMRHHYICQKPSTDFRNGTQVIG